MPLIIAISIISILIILVLWYISVINKLNKSIVKIDEASSGIDVALTKRYDVLTKMIEIVKGYAKHEKETLFEIINIRNGMTTNEKNETNQKMDKLYDQIKILVENYPDLKANENFNTLQVAISQTEDELQTSRKLYNSQVSIYNQMIVTFPNTIVASMSGKKQRDFFEAEEQKKNDVKINL